MKVLVTGATGFIGSRLVKKLVEQKNNVRCLVRSTSNTKQLESLGIELVTGDIHDRASLTKAIQGCDMIYHLAANAHPDSVTPYNVYKKANVDTTNNVLEAAAAYGKCKKVLVMSSIAAVGPSRDGTLLNEDSPRLPITNYGKSKLAVEDLCRRYYHEKNLPIVVIRPPMVYGIGDKNWIDFFLMIKGGGMPLLGIPIPGSHENLFDFCYVDNLVDGLMLAANSPGSSGKVYFISDEKSYKIKDIIQAVANAYNIPCPVKFWPLWIELPLVIFFDVISFVIRKEMPLDRRTLNWMTKNYWVCDTTKAKRELGYKPAISLAEGVKRTVDWISGRKNT